MVGDEDSGKYMKMNVHCWSLLVGMEKRPGDHGDMIDMMVFFHGDGTRWTYPASHWKWVGFISANWADLWGAFT